MTRRNALVLVVALLGIPAGVGAFTFVYAKGSSYLSADPRACVNCHVMNPQYDAWLKSGHRHTATCVECHLPHAGLAKWAAKAEHGFRHSAAFTLQNFKEPIEITPRDREMVRANCVLCHEGLVQAVADAPGRAHGGSIACTATRAPDTARVAETEKIMMEGRAPGGRQRGWLLALLAMLGITGVTVLLLALLTNIFERKQEARQAFVRVVDVTEDTADPKVWSQNWPLQYDH